MDKPMKVLEIRPGIDIGLHYKMWKGKAYFDIREWRQSSMGFYPTSKGVSIPVEVLKEFIKLLQTATNKDEEEEPVEKIEITIKGDQSSKITALKTLLIDMKDFEINQALKELTAQQIVRVARQIHNTIHREHMGVL